MPNRFRSKLENARRQTGECLRTVVWQSYKCLMWTICAPCICCLLVFLGPGRHGRRRAPLLDIALPMVPAPRRRALSISGDLQEGQSTLAQTRSTFMNKLPLEIRRMIYEMALGGQPIHTSVSDGQLIARRCALRNCLCYMPCSPGQKLQLALPLLRTCRQIYSEAIEYLYKTNQFFMSTDLEDFPTAGYLCYFFQPQRFAQVSNLSIEWDLDRHQYFQVNLMPAHHRHEWYRLWDGLSKMTGLKRLHIKLYFCLDLWQGCYGEFWEQNSKEILQPIKKVTAPRDFVVTLPNWRCSTDFDVGDSNCVFKLPERDDQEGSAS